MIVRVWRPRVVCLLLAIAMFAALSSRPVSAQTHRRTVVLPIQWEGNVSEVGKDDLVRMLLEGLAAAGFQVVAADQLVDKLFKDAPALKSCNAADCFVQIAKAVGANYLVVVRTVVEQRNYEMSLRLVNGASGEVAAKATEVCDICGIREAGETIQLAATALKEGLEKQEAPAQITIETDPPGALITLDGRPVGFAPSTLDVTSGMHELRISADGHETVTRPLEVAPGSAQELQIHLPSHPVPLSGGAWKWIGWASAVTGLALMAGGAYALSLHGEESRCRPPTIEEDPGGQLEKICRFHQTKLLSGALLATGGVLTGFGGLAIYVNLAGQQGGHRAQPAEQDHALRAPSWQIAVHGRF